MPNIYDELGKTLSAMEDERQEACIGCGRVWYVIHHRDGLCHQCQAASKPGRSVLQKRHNRWEKVFSFFVAWLSWDAAFLLLRP